MVIIGEKEIEEKLKNEYKLNKIENLYIVHYTKLKERRKLLEDRLLQYGIYNDKRRKNDNNKKNEGKNTTFTKKTLLISFI